MTEVVTLELSEAVARQAHETANRTGRSLEQVLIDWIERGVQRDLESLIVPGVEYPIYTPLGNEQSAQVLCGVLKTP
jgi:hypothetical protein